MRVCVFVLVCANSLCRRFRRFTTHLLNVYAKDSLHFAGQTLTNNYLATATIVYCVYSVYWLEIYGIINIITQFTVLQGGSKSVGRYVASVCAVAIALKLRTHIYVCFIALLSQYFDHHFHICDEPCYCYEMACRQKISFLRI